MTDGLHIVTPVRPYKATQDELAHVRESNARMAYQMAEIAQQLRALADAMESDMEMQPFVAQRAADLEQSYRRGFEAGAASEMEDRLRLTLAMHERVEAPRRWRVFLDWWLAVVVVGCVAAVVALGVTG